jgi:uncharacterized protein YbbC (DUF1343 family)
MKHLFAFFLICSVTLFAQPKIKLGIDVLKESNFEILNGKRVGLITNATGVDSKLKSTIDILFEAPEVNLTALYGPEHGVRGDFPAGDYVENYVDPKTGLTVYSLYGKTRKPTPEMLKDVDLLVYDIQDIGCRSYTYISTMGVSMEAAAEHGKEFVVLDRPNPLGGNRIEGNLVEEGYISFVSQFKIPYVYGLTCGELANLLNNEKMLKDGAKVNLTVIAMKGWNREMEFEDTGLHWVPTSPHIPHKDSPKFYVATGILGELGVISEGVGYTVPFQVLGAEWIDASLLSEEMNKIGIEGVHFRPVTYKPFYGRDTTKELHGVQIHFEDHKNTNLMNIQFHFMEVHNRLYPDKNIFRLANKNRFGMFDKVAGSSRVRELFSDNMKFENIKNYFEKDIENFKSLSAKYHLY